MTFKEWVEKWKIGPGMNDASGTELYSGFDGTVGMGWVGILDRLASDLIEMGWDRRVVQIKEKFGTLRFCVGEASSLVFDRIEAAERESETTCEYCGASGCLRDGNWIKTLCDECAPC